MWANRRILNKRSDRIIILIIIISVSHVCGNTCNAQRLMHSAYSLHICITKPVCWRCENKVASSFFFFFWFGPVLWAIMYILWFFHVGHFIFIYFITFSRFLRTHPHCYGGIHMENSKDQFQIGLMLRINAKIITNTINFSSTMENVNPFSKC